jgi:hypothetical protein
MSPQIHTYAELQQQIHNDLRIQHPDWVNSDGSSPMCDSYESRLAELLETLTRRGPNEFITAPQMKQWCDRQHAEITALG